MNHTHSSLRYCCRNRVVVNHFLMILKMQRDIGARAKVKFLLLLSLIDLSRVLSYLKFKVGARGLRRAGKNAARIWITDTLNYSLPGQKREKERERERQKEKKSRNNSESARHASSEAFLLGRKEIRVRRSKKNFFSPVKTVQRELAAPETEREKWKGKEKVSMAEKSLRIGWNVRGPRELHFSEQLDNRRDGANEIFAKIHRAPKQILRYFTSYAWRFITGAQRLYLLNYF